MRNYIAVVFDDTSKVYEGLHALWQIDDEAAITVHGTTVVHRNDWGEYQVDSKDTHPALATAVGVGIGALFGRAGGSCGRGDWRRQGGGDRRGIGRRGWRGRGSRIARTRATNRATRPRGCSASVNRPSSPTSARTRPFAVDERMRRLGGSVHRRAYGDVRDDKWFDDYPYDYYLYPYEYVPPYSPWWAA